MSAWQISLWNFKNGFKRRASADRHILARSYIKKDIGTGGMAADIDVGLMVGLAKIGFETIPKKMMCLQSVWVNEYTGAKVKPKVFK